MDTAEPLHKSWKFWVALIAFQTLFQVFASWILPELPPIWVAVGIAAIFAGFAVLAPLVIARRRGTVRTPETPS